MAQFNGYILGIDIFYLDYRILDMTLVFLAKIFLIVDQVQQINSKQLTKRQTVQIFQ